METHNQNTNKLFKASRGTYDEASVTYDGRKLIAHNKFDTGSDVNFNWGDSSDGSQTLSYAILSNVGSKDIAHRYAKIYTKNVISNIKKDNWTLNATAVIQWINENTNYSIDERAYVKDGTTTYEYTERREEDRRKEERRIKREQDFQEKIQKRLKEYESENEERRQEDRRQEERRIICEQDFQDKAQKRLKEYEEEQKEKEKIKLEEEIHAKYQYEINNYKKLILTQKADIESYKLKLQKYRFFVDSLDVKSMYEKYCELDT